MRLSGQEAAIDTIARSEDCRRLEDTAVSFRVTITIRDVQYQKSHVDSHLAAKF